MKHFLIFATVACILFSCNNSTNSSGSGINVGKTVVTIKDKPVSKKEFTYGESINVRFKNVTGLTKFEGKVHPKALIYLLNESKDTVEINDYEFENKFVTGEPIDLDINFLAMLTEATNKNFELKIKLEDTKGEGSYDYSMPFKIKPNHNFVVKAEGISYSNIYLFNPKDETVITDNIIKPKGEFEIVYEGLKGFDTDNIGFIYPAASAKVVDANGAVLLDENNLLENYKALGFKYEKAFSSLPLNIKLNDFGTAVSPFKLMVELYDLKSDNKIELETTLAVK